MAPKRRGRVAGAYARRTIRHHFRIGEVRRKSWRGGEESRRNSRQALILPGDPLKGHARRFAYRVSPKYDVADAAALPDGSLVVSNGVSGCPFDFRIGSSWFLPPRSHPDAWRGGS